MVHLERLLAKRREAAAALAQIPIPQIAGNELGIIVLNYLERVISFSTFLWRIFALHLILFFHNNF